MGCKFGGFHTALLGFENSLEQLTELRTTLTSTVYHGEYNLEMAKGKRCTGEGKGEVYGSPLPPCLDVFTNLNPTI